VQGDSKEQTANSNDKIIDIVLTEILSHHNNDNNAFVSYPPHAVAPSSPRPSS